MPQAAPRPCCHPGCKELIGRGERYCAAHRAVLRRADDRRRGSAHSRGYDRDWQRLRALVLSQHPLCVMCQEEGRLAPATVVDHIVPIADAPDRRLDPENLRPLCKRHHDQRTAREQAWGRGGQKV